VGGSANIKSRPSQHALSCCRNHLLGTICPESSFSNILEIHSSQALRLPLSDSSGEASSASEVGFSSNVPYVDGTLTSATPSATARLSAACCSSSWALSRWSHHPSFELQVLPWFSHSPATTEIDRTVNLHADCFCNLSCIFIKRAVCGATGNKIEISSPFEIAKRSRLETFSSTYSEIVMGIWQNLHLVPFELLFLSI